MLLDYYKEKLDINAMPIFLKNYLNLNILKRLNGITYLCGMDYASKDIYDFKEFITRYDHSLTVALLVWKLTHDKVKTLAGLFHDISTPCFSHVIDYMNKDYENQESTEEYTEYILINDKKFNELINRDGINIEDIINFKKYSIVDNDRPMLCADRLDGLILTGISWTKDVDKKIIDLLIDNIVLYKNELDNEEIGFDNMDSFYESISINNNINILCHTNEDNYMMELMASIIKLSIERKYISYNELYTLSELELLNKLNNIIDIDLSKKLNLFYHIKKDEIPNTEIPKVKQRIIKPLVSGKRLI